MHIFKRLAAAALLPALTAALLLPAQAAGCAGDRDAFYRRHAGECFYDEGSYYLNGEQGYVTLYRSPQSEQAVDYLLNERLADVHCVWTDKQGVRWGQLRYNSTGRGLAFCDEQGESCGWLRMSALAARYDRDRFLYDHLAEFTPESAELDTSAYASVGLWAFPGCGGRAEPVSWYMRRDAEPVLRFPAVWTDSAGRRWGSVRFETVSGFVCLDEPNLADNRLPEIVTGYLAIPAADADTLPRVRETAASALPVWVWPALAVGAAAAAAVVLETKERRERKEE